MSLEAAAVISRSVNCLTFDEPLAVGRDGACDLWPSFLEWTTCGHRFPLQGRSQIWFADGQTAIQYRKTAGLSLSLSHTHSLSLFFFLK